jgi:hypothetical protein
MSRPEQQLKHRSHQFALSVMKCPFAHKETVATECPMDDSPLAQVRGMLNQEALRMLRFSHMQRLPTGHQHFELWTSREQVRHLQGSAEHLLEVVQEQQHLPLLQLLHETLQEGLAGRLLDAQSLSDGGYNQCGIANGSQIHEKHAIEEIVPEFGCHLQAQAGFAYPTRTRQSE